MKFIKIFLKELTAGKVPLHSLYLQVGLLHFNFIGFSLLYLNVEIFVLLYKSKPK